MIRTWSEKGSHPVGTGDGIGTGIQRETETGMVREIETETDRRTAKTRAKVDADDTGTVTTEETTYPQAPTWGHCDPL